jgi:hypothetical protein
MRSVNHDKISRPKNPLLTARIAINSIDLTTNNNVPNPNTTLQSQLKSLQICPTATARETSITTSASKSPTLVAGRMSPRAEKALVELFAHKTMTTQNKTSNRKS